MDKFNNKFRIPSARLQSWNYGTNGAYFITICSKNRENLFGVISEGKMKLNALGLLAEKYWLEIPAYFPFIELGNFVVMPNHTHGILIIDRNKLTVETRLIASLHRPIAPLQQPQAPQKIGGITGNKNPMLHDNISRIIRWYKGRCTFELRKIHPNFMWQSRFHDHIIRDEQSFETIQNYISDNPINWEKDKFFNQHI